MSCSSTSAACLIDFAGFEELGRLLPGTPDRAEVRTRWIESESVQRFERGAITPLEFARGVIGDLELASLARRLHRSLCRVGARPLPRRESLLAQLHATHRLACLSNSNELHTPLHRRSMEPLMDRYYFSDELGMVKPDPEIFEHVIRDLGGPPGPDRLLRRHAGQCPSRPRRRARRFRSRRHRPAVGSPPAVGPAPGPPSISLISDHSSS